MRRTKIVCTLGPASNSDKVIGDMVRAGMDVARLNFSHGSQAEHLGRVKMVRRVSAKIGKPVAILMDLQGPRVRVGEFAGHNAFLKKGADFILTSRKILGHKEIVSVTYTNLPREVKKGDPIYINDGAIRLAVTKIDGQDVHTKVVEGGYLSDHKGINLPATTLSTPSVTRKDMADLKFGLSIGVDFVGLSFVRSPEDVKRVKAYIRKAGKDTPVIAKIEKFEALKRLEEIIHEADGVMVARGDLGVEMPLDEVPEHQKRIIHECARHMKPVITATQMLESMTDHARPTRAEVSDVANAILDGTDAVMLSGETSVGKYPVQTVRTMANIALKTERMVGEGYLVPIDDEEIPISDSVAQAASFLAEGVEAKAIIAFTASGFTARLISKFRPGRLVLGVSPHAHVMRRMALYWGVMPIQGKGVKTVDDMVEKTIEGVRKMGLLKKGDITVITAGAPLGVSGKTNLIKVHTI